MNPGLGCNETLACVALNMLCLADIIAWKVGQSKTPRMLRPVTSGLDPLHLQRRLGTAELSHSTAVLHPSGLPRDHPASPLQVAVRLKGSL